MFEQGKKLKEARKEKELSIAEVSEKIKIHPDKIRAIENGETGSFPGKFYAERFLKTYADFLGVQVDIPAKENNEPDSFTETKEKKKEDSKKIISIAAWAVIAAGMILLLLGAGRAIFVQIKEKQISRDAHQIVPAGQLEPSTRTIRAVPEDPVWLSINRAGEEIFSGIITEPAEWEGEGEIAIRIGNVYALRLYIKRGEEYFREIDIEEGSSQGVNNIVITDDLSQ